MAVLDGTINVQCTGCGAPVKCNIDPGTFIEIVELRKRIAEHVKVCGRPDAVSNV